MVSSFFDAVALQHPGLLQPPNSGGESAWRITTDDLTRLCDVLPLAATDTFVCVRLAPPSGTRRAGALPGSAARTLARRGAAVELLYLLPDRACSESSWFAEQVSHDRAAGITPRCVVLDTVLVTALDALSGSLEFLSGAAFGAVPETGGSGGIEADGWLLDPGQARVAATRDAYDLARVASVAIDDDPRWRPPGERFDDPVVSCAVRAATLAETRAWYHGFWPTLRAVGLGATPTTHADFYTTVLGELARGGRHPRVLVSGSADYMMPARVLATYANAGTDLDLTLLDRCPTPLALARWYAGRVGTTLDTVAADILEFETDAAYDVVVTHSFLGYFPPTVRPKLLARWHAALRPGGKLVAINRVRPGPDDQLASFSAEQATQLRDFVLREARKRRQYLHATPEQLAERATLYAGGFHSHPLTSRDALAELLSAGGFAVDEIELRAPCPDSGVSGPTTPGNAVYAQFVATRT